MTPAELRALIDGDVEAAQLASAGKDAACAGWLSEIAPRERRPYLITKRTLHRMFGLIRGVQIMGQLRAVAESGDKEQAPIAAEVVDLLQPRGGDGDGLDISHPDAKTFLQQWAAAGLVTADEASQLLALAKVRATITADQVSAAMAADRTTDQHDEGAK
ncbi:MAG: hypothetical protein A3E01_10745 [Gammaproteobacteria bacterium RIFCSPHIGHO2_12_FULL_63_22]|nr:MAG: hypothetical protein A3E01_10745 [Gammaproteobacteria bacterium RIFCSPHIGHO2_12_FULL_63_22]